MYFEETGNAKRFSKKLLAIVNGSFNAKIVPLDKANLEDNLGGNRIFITSTFGNGDPPEMATGLQSWLQRKTQVWPLIIFFLFGF